MQSVNSCFILSYPKELNKIGSSLNKELKNFAKKYGRILVLDKQRTIEINLILSDNLSISTTKRIINIRLFNKINKDEVAILLKNRIIAILEKENVFVPDYIKEEINECFDLNKKIKNNIKETNAIIEDIVQGR